MTARDFARDLVTDAEYRASVLARARAGTLDPDLECLIWEFANDNRVPMSVARAGSAPTAAPPQSRTLAIIRPPNPQEKSHEN